MHWAVHLLSIFICDPFDGRGRRKSVNGRSLVIRVVDVCLNLVIYGLGIALLWPFHKVLILFYLAASAIGIMWFMATICPHCASFGHTSCMTGLGYFSSLVFRPRDRSRFQKAFLGNIWSTFPGWFIPIFAMVFQLLEGAEIWYIGLSIMFVTYSFVLFPLYSKFFHCVKCPQKGDCPYRTNPFKNAK